MKVATHMTLMVLLGLEIKGALIATAMPKPILTSLKLADLALLEMVERIKPYLLFYMPCRRLCGVKIER